MVEEAKNEVEYDGFATPCFICVGSDTSNKGDIIDPYAKLPEGSRLKVGMWSKGWQDNLIHVYLLKPNEELMNERQEWIDKKLLLSEEQIEEYNQTPRPELPLNEEHEKHISTPKKKVVLDPETKQFKLI